MKEKVYLLGHPVAHSKSPVMHNALYQKLGLDWEYSLKDCETEEEARRFIEKRDFLGINITSPYKPLAYSSADVRAASAKLARGANVLAKKGDALIAYNMDGDGCVAFLKRRGFDFRDALVVVCGTGPTSLAALHSAALAGANKVVLVGRNKERTRTVLKEYTQEFGKLTQATIDMPPLHEGYRSFLEAYKGTEFSSGSYQETAQVFRDADLIINATPIGMDTDQQLPFDANMLHEGQTVFDAVYGHGETTLISTARAKGCKVCDGLGMLVAQAAATDRAFFEIADLSFDLSDEEMFVIMGHAAGFEW